MDNPKVEVQKSKQGKGLFAKENIRTGEVIAKFEGKKFKAAKATDLPDEAGTHAVQYAEHLHGEAKEAAEKLIKEGFILAKPASYGLQISLNPEKLDEIIKIIKN